MPPRLNMWGACRSIAIRSRPQFQPPQPRAAALVRQFVDDSRPPASIPGHQGGMIPPSMIRPTGTSNERSEGNPISKEDVQMREPTPNEIAVNRLELTANGVNPFSKRFTGYNFEEPVIPEGKINETKFHLRHRYDEGISQLTRLLMRDGKLSKAQRDMAMLLNYLRTSPPPRINPQRPLLPGSPPPEHLPLNPDLYLMLAIDSVAPLIQVRGLTGLAGGGKALEVPVPITKRARRRTAFTWIMDTVNKRPSAGSGKKMLAHKIGEEIVAVVEGKSSVWERRNQLHKVGTSVRANLNSPALKRKPL